MPSVIAQHIANAYIRLMSEIHYIALFGADSDTLRQRLGLPQEDTPDDDNLRDHMGIEALEALAEVERECAVQMRRNPEWTPARCLERCEDIGKYIGVKWQQRCVLKQVDFLTGRQLEEMF